MLTVLSVVTMLFAACTDDPIPPGKKDPNINPPGKDILVPAVSVDFKTTQFEVSMKITPNDSVKDYRFIILKKGEMPVQIEQFGPMFGCTDTLSYIRALGAEQEGVYEYTFTDMIPDTDWELFVLPRGLNGEEAPLQIFTTATKAIGGSGEAKVEIEIIEYVLSVDNETGEIKPVLLVSVTPNEQCVLFRYLVIEKEVYDCDTLDWGEDGVLDYLKLDNNPAYPSDRQDPYWNHYEKAEEGWYVKAATTYYIFGLGKNSEGVYGPLVREDYTTPAEKENPAASPVKFSNIRKSFCNK